MMEFLQTNVHIEQRLPSRRGIMYPTTNSFEQRNPYQEDSLSHLVQKGSESITSPKSSGAEIISVEDVYSLIINGLEDAKAEQIQPINIPMPANTYQLHFFAHLIRFYMSFSPTAGTYQNRS